MLMFGIMANGLTSTNPCPDILAKPKRGMKAMLIACVEFDPSGNVISIVS